MISCTLRPVPEPVKRRYRSPRRAERAAATQRAIHLAARELFTTKGYAATAVADVASRAGVSVDTVYASVGRKPQLMQVVIDMALASSDRPATADERDYVQEVRAAPTAAAKLATYAAALGRIMPNVAPLFDALTQAALTDPECAALRASIAGRRAANMKVLAAELRATGDLRADLSDADVAHILWTTNAPEYYALVAGTWSDERYAELLTDLWTRLLLDRS